MNIIDLIAALQSIVVSRGEKLVVVRNAEESQFPLYLTFGPSRDGPAVFRLLVADKAVPNRDKTRPKKPPRSRHV